MSSSRAVQGGLVACGIACLLSAGACSTDEEAPAADSAKKPSVEREPARPKPEPERRATCPPNAANCRTASGRILYVERVDPDGDGDAHFVLVSREGITAPGLSVIDVRKGLRPSPLPGPGDWISAAGPVGEGSYGQSQIHAVRLRVARRG